MSEQIPWYSQKSTWAAITTMVTGCLGFFTDIMTPQQTAGVLTIMGGITAIFIRQGVEKTKPVPPPEVKDEQEGN